MCELFKTNKNSTYFQHMCTGCCNDVKWKDSREKQYCVLACKAKDLKITPPCICTSKNKTETMEIMR